MSAPGLKGWASFSFSQATLSQPRLAGDLLPPPPQLSGSGQASIRWPFLPGDGGGGVQLSWEEGRSTPWRIGEGNAGIHPSVLLGRMVSEDAHVLAPKARRQGLASQILLAPGVPKSHLSHMV